MTGTPSVERLQQLENRRESLRQSAEHLLLEARDAGRTELTPGEAERLRQMTADLRGLDEHVAEYRADLERVASLMEARMRDGQ